MANKKVKIIIVDNFDRETVSDTLLADNVIEHYAHIICDLLNKREGENTANYYRVVDLDYELYNASILY